MVLIELEEISQEEVQDFQEVLEQSKIFERMVEKFELVGGDFDQASVTGYRKKGVEDTPVDIVYRGSTDDGFELKLSFSISLRNNMKRTIHPDLEISPMSSQEMM